MGTFVLGGIAGAALTAAALKIYFIGTKDGPKKPVVR